MNNKQQPTLLDNWIGWLQARIPALKESHNVFWLKQAMGGYKSENEQYFPKVSVLTPEAPDKIPSAEEYLIQHLLNRCEENSTTKISDEEITEILDDPEMIAFVQMLESYALLREKRAVNQAKKEWIEERDSIMKNLNNHCDYVSLTLDGMRPEKAAKECNLL